MSKSLYSIVFMSLALLSSIASAAPNTQNHVSTPMEAALGIVSPDVAIGVYRTKRFTYTNSREILVCVQIQPTNNDCVDNKNKSAWRPLAGAVPDGKKYVGFKSVTDIDGSHAIEIYWK